ncbi:MAG: hypothetical protein LBD50_00550, partial [Rickettsiales bacterium]|nr:hypothetical protein [Rickettsiales bacterium]
FFSYKQKKEEIFFYYSNKNLPEKLGSLGWRKLPAFLPSLPRGACPKLGFHSFIKRGMSRARICPSLSRGACPSLLFVLLFIKMGTTPPASLVFIFYYYLLNLIFLMKSAIKI